MFVFFQPQILSLSHSVICVSLITTESLPLQHIYLFLFNGESSRVFITVRWIFFFWDPNELREKNRTETDELRFRAVSCSGRNSDDTDVTHCSLCVCEKVLLTFHPWWLSAWLCGWLESTWANSVSVQRCARASCILCVYGCLFSGIYLFYIFFCFLKFAVWYLIKFLF